MASSESEFQKHCPLCGESNDCALARPAADPPRECWCASRSFPPELRDRAAGHAACICERCLEKSTET